MECIGKWVLISIIVLFFIGLTHFIYGEEISREESGVKGAVSSPTPTEGEKHKEPFKPDREAPVTIEADHLEYYKETDIYEAWGSVKITQDDAHLESDYATLDNRSGDALALGNVWYDDGESILISEKIELNFNTKLGVVYKGRIFNRPDNYHIEGEEIEKLGEDTYKIKRGSFTTCDALVPSWRFRGKDVKVYLNDNISARNVVFYIKDIPFLYTPYIKVPIKKERHSGFLFPRLGYGNQKGFIIQNAFFWAMADNMDSTFYFDYRSKIGFGGGVEYRYVLSKDARGDLYNYYLKDRELKKDFWDVRFNHDHRITDRLQGKANIIYLSEPIYYQRFSTLTEERIQRGLESNLLLSQSWRTSRLYSLGQYRQDLTQSNSGTLQKLPEIGYVLTNYRIGGLPLYFGFESTAINYWRKTGTKGQRLNIYPQISSNLNFGRGFVFSPRAGFRERAYAVGGDITDKGIYDLGATIGTKIFRIFDVNGVLGMDKIKHSIEPSISYAYIPEVSQQALPQFDGLDFIPETNMINYSLTNRLIGKYGEGEKKRTIEFLTLKLSQGYDLNKKKEPLSDVIIEATARAPELFSFNTSSTYNPYSGYLTTFNSGLTLRGDTPWYISIDERYTKIPESLFFTTEGSVRVTKTLDLSGKIWYDATQSKFMEVDLKGTYSSQCWAITLIYIERPEETQFLMTIDLKGLGTLRLPSFSQRAI